MKQRYDDRRSQGIAGFSICVDRRKFKEESVILGVILIQVTGVRQGIIKFAAIDTGESRNGGNDRIPPGGTIGGLLILPDADRGKSARWQVRAGSEFEFYIQAAPGVDDGINGSNGELWL